jgi:hypothetical protein
MFHASSRKYSIRFIVTSLAFVSLTSWATSESHGAPAPAVTLGKYSDTSLPLSTNTTVAPDAAPIDATRINVSTSTDFKGELEGDPLTGVVRVTDAHPGGAYTVTVIASDSGGATTMETFMLTVTTPATCMPVSFAAAVDYDAGPSPRSVAVGDFNGDSNQDLAVADSGSNNVSILLGDGAGNFRAPTNFLAGNSPWSVAVGDFNGDGNQDLAVGNAFDNRVSVFLGDGTGNFTAPTNYTTGFVVQSVAVGDFNGDGKQDLAASNHNNSNVSILLGDGTGNFSAATNFGTGFFPKSVAIGDFNGDGRQDLAIARASNNVSILLGNGEGSFSAPTTFAAGSFPTSVAVGDFNGDAKEDLAVANDNTFSPASLDDVSVLLGDGAGSFSTATHFSAGITPRSVAVGDFNGDNNQDLAVADSGSHNVSILLGDGTGSFSAPTNFGAGSGAFSVAVGDFNSDANQDLAVANAGSRDVSILLRDCQNDECPDDPDKTEPGICGCGVPDADGDGDGTADCVDQCPNDASNDVDGDGPCGDVDNCPGTSNGDQADADADGSGDACDACPNDANDDADGDGLCADVDNCTNDSNDDQADADGDTVGDVCDGDDDNDGVADGSDLCPGTPAGTPVNASGCPKPTNPDQCKKDGWRTLFRADGTPFRSQGDCMQYVNTGK